MDLRLEKPAEALERLAESDPARALEILHTSRKAFQLLGLETEVNEVTGLIQKLEEPEQPAP